VAGVGHCCLGVAGAGRESGAPGAAEFVTFVLAWRPYGAGRVGWLGCPATWWLPGARNHGAGGLGGAGVGGIPQLVPVVDGLSPGAALRISARGCSAGWAEYCLGWVKVCAWGLWAVGLELGGERGNWRPRASRVRWRRGGGILAEGGWGRDSLGRRLFAWGGARTMSTRLDVTERGVSDQFPNRNAARTGDMCSGGCRLGRRCARSIRACDEGGDGAARRRAINGRRDQTELRG